MEVISFRTDYVRCNIRAGSKYGSAEHVRISKGAAAAIMKRFERISYFTALQAMKLIHMLKDDVFPRDIYDELAQEVNR